MTSDRAWVDVFSAHLQPVFDAADVGLDCSQVNESALLWEADPRQFAERCPDSGIIETYGVDQWPSVHCIDFWFYLDRDAGGEIRSADAAPRRALDPAPADLAVVLDEPVVDGLP